MNAKPEDTAIMVYTSVTNQKIHNIGKRIGKRFSIRSGRDCADAETQTQCHRRKVLELANEFIQIEFQFFEKMTVEIAFVFIYTKENVY